MKKVLAGLISISFLAVLLVPTIASARTAGWPDCPNSCDVASVECNCDNNSVTASNPKYCWGGERYSLDDGGKAACRRAAAGGSTGTGGSAEQQQIPGEGQVPSTPGEIVDLIEDIGDWIFTALLVVAAIFLVIAGYRFVFAGGNEENVKKARQMLINALIGVAVALGAKGLVAVIKSLIGA